MHTDKNSSKVILARELEIYKEASVTNPSVEVQTECSPSELGSVESEVNSHASSEVPLDPELTTTVKVIKTLILPILLHPELRTAAKVIKIFILPIPLEE
ncbi:hypothetical protein R3W88_033201 [Solanum pinnatisectum]|uniref:Uncharacterized protein n=1 Tax=Solanum pinnatisectum TaxID=50273 RepID=A0AAV9K240_9SOLN|nr:hypothetical protein R3W88_033201 [Solanum pinnatisectum]